MPHPIAAGNRLKGRGCQGSAVALASEALGRSLPAISAVERIQENLHLLIEQRVRRQFLLGEHEQAIFVAVKAVEIRVRRLVGFTDDIIGTDLVTRALKPGGPLADPEAPAARSKGP